MKKKIFTNSLIFILISLILLLLYSRYIATSGIKVNEKKIESKKISETFHGFKIVHFSDTHLGTSFKIKHFKKLIKKIDLIKPDILIFTGDFIDSSYSITNEDIKIITKEFKKLNYLLGKYAVLGEDDLNDNTLKILKDNKFIILNNRTDYIYNKDNTYLSISGLNIENPSFEELDINKNYFNILIAHQGDDLTDLNNVDLALGGHSHNGQIRFPYIGSLFQKEGSKKYHLPYYKINDMELFISNGLGTSQYHLRLFNRPSINFFRITKK